MSKKNGSEVLIVVFAFIFAIALLVKGSVFPAGSPGTTDSPYEDTIARLARLASASAAAAARSPMLTATLAPVSSPTTVPTAAPTATPAPTPTYVPVQGIIVAIDAGHGGDDTGASAYDGTLLEKNITIDIANQVVAILNANGINTYMARQGDASIDRKVRIANANEIGASLYVSIHCDWYDDPSINGSTTYYDPTNTYMLYAPSGKTLSHAKFAGLIHNSVVNALGTYDRGLRTDTTYSVTKRALMPSAIAELGFMSNPGDLAKLANPWYRTLAARAIADGIMAALETVR